MNDNSAFYPKSTSLKAKARVTIQHPEVTGPANEPILKNSWIGGLNKLDLKKVKRDNSTKKSSSRKRTADQKQRSKRSI